MLLAVCLSGCAGLAIQLATEAAASAVFPRAPIPINPAVKFFSYPVSRVFLITIQTVERNDRKIQQQDNEAHTIKVRYPFSFFSNNFGGLLAITLAPDGEGTRMTIAGIGHDTNDRIHKLAEAIFDDVDKALVSARQ